MKALILNSGIGSRLEKYTKDHPKCMVEIREGITILQYQIDLLRRFGINEVIITTGYMDSTLRSFADSIKKDMTISYYHNMYYQTTNYIKSLDLVNDIADDLLLLHGDLIFDEQLLDMIINNEKSCMVIDKSLPLPNKDFKAKMSCNRISAVGIHYFGEDCVAAQPLYKLLNRDWCIWKDSIHDFCTAGNTNVYAEEAFNVISDRLELVGIDAKGKLCMEVDNEEDLHKIRLLLEKGKRYSG